MSSKNILITGKPGVGKTTLIKRLIDELGLDAGGFYTKEVRSGKERVGFDIQTLDGKTGVLARKGMRSQYRLSKYGVDIKDLEEIGVEALREAIDEHHAVVIDEIGKMELFSEEFKREVVRALDSDKLVLGTIKLAVDPFTDEIKNRDDTQIFEITLENREQVKSELVDTLRDAAKKGGKE